MHSNSIDAYESEKVNLSKRALSILTELESRPRPCSDRQLKDRLGYSDMNMVRPRVTELIGKGLVFEVGKYPCEITGKSVRLILHFKYVEMDKRQLELF